MKPCFVHTCFSFRCLDCQGGYYLRVTVNGMTTLIPVWP